MNEPAENAPPVTIILRISAEEMGVGVKDILSRDRREELALQRQVVMWLCTEVYAYDNAHVGRMMNRNDSTVYYGSMSVGRVVNRSPKLAHTVEVIKRRLASWQSDPALIANRARLFERGDA